jgi:DNA recombination protein RmuC
MNITLNQIEIALLIALIIVSVLLLLFAIFYYKQREKNSLLLARLSTLQQANSELEETLNGLNLQIATFQERQKYFDELKSEYKELEVKYGNKTQELNILKTKLEDEKEAFRQKLEMLQAQEEQLKSSFKNLANEILENTKEKIQKESKSSIEQLLKPLSIQISDFKGKIEHLSKEEAKEISALQNELKSLKELSFQLSSQAQNLTNALKGDNKKQGVWGEMVLYRVLELSGLREGSEYKKEVALKSIDNQLYRPDVVVYLPNDREVIIDAKTSLVAYKNYIEAQEDGLKESYLKAHVASIKRHIDTLSEKKYEQLQGINTLDFIFIFIPIENALLCALEANSELFEYAFKKRVILVSPTTLLVSLRAIESSWRYERQAKNIAEVIRNAESLYDKTRGFVEEFVKVGKSLDSAKLSFENAKSRLSSGKGNLLRQIEMLKEKANIKPKKELPKDLLE